MIFNRCCTTICLAPLAKVLNAAKGVERGIMTTIHSDTGDQPTLDQCHNNLQHTRAAAAMIPTSTGAARALSEMLSYLAGTLDGTAIRLTTPNVFSVNLTFEAAREVTVKEVNATLKPAANAEMSRVISYDPEPTVSENFNQTDQSCIMAPARTKVVGSRTLHVLAWYDNEWAFSTCMADVAARLTHRG